MIDDSAYWTQLRRELIKWLDDRAPSFTEGYEGAVRLLYLPSFPARVHFICHAVRDIYRYLPGAFGIHSLPRPAEVFPGMVKELANCWSKFPPKDCGTYSGQVGSDTPVSPEVHACLINIIRKQAEIADQRTVGKQLAIALFRSLERRRDDFIAPWIIKAFDAEFDFFVKRAHLPAKATDCGLLEHFEAFERAFHSLVGPYFSGKDELDAILQDTNSAAD